MDKIVPIREWGTVDGVVRDVRLETYPSDYAETERQVVVVEVELGNGRTRRFFYPYSDAPNSKLNMLVERVEELLGDRVEYLSDIVGYFSRWRRYTRKITLSNGDEVDVQVWLPTELRATPPADFESVQVEVEDREPKTETEEEEKEEEGDEVDEKAILKYIENSIDKYGSVAIKDVAKALGVDKATVIEIATDHGYVIRNRVIFAE